MNNNTLTVDLIPDNYTLVTNSQDLTALADFAPKAAMSGYCFVLVGEGEYLSIYGNYNDNGPLSGVPFMTDSVELIYGKPAYKSYYDRSEEIPFKILDKADMYVCRLLGEKVSEDNLNDYTEKAVRWVNDNMGLDLEYMESTLQEALAVMGLIETEYTAKTWAKNNGIVITYKRNGYHKYGKPQYLATITVNGVLVDDTFDIATHEDIEDMIYDSVLSFFYYFCDNTTIANLNNPVDPDDDDFYVLTVTKKLLNALTEKARNEFVNGQVTFRE